MAANEGLEMTPCVPQAALWGSLAVLAPFLLGGTLSVPVCVCEIVILAWLLCLACGICGIACLSQSIFSLFEASLPMIDHSYLPDMSVFLLLFLAFSWKRKGL